MSEGAAWATGIGTGQLSAPIAGYLTNAYGYKGPIERAKKALKAQQLAAFFGQLAQGYNTFNPVARTISDNMLGNAQAGIQYENEKIAELKGKQSQAKKSAAKLNTAVNETVGSILGGYFMGNSQMGGAMGRNLGDTANALSGFESWDKAAESAPAVGYQVGDMLSQVKGMKGGGGMGGMMGGMGGDKLGAMGFGGGAAPASGAATTGKLNSADIPAMGAAQEVEKQQFLPPQYSNGRGPMAPPVQAGAGGSTVSFGGTNFWK